MGGPPKRWGLEAAVPYRVSAAIGRSRSKKPVLWAAGPYRVSLANGRLYVRRKAISALRLQRKKNRAKDERQEREAE